MANNSPDASRRASLSGRGAILPSTLAQAGTAELADRSLQSSVAATSTDRTGESLVAGQGRPALGPWSGQDLSASFDDGASARPEKPDSLSVDPAERASLSLLAADLYRTAQQLELAGNSDLASLVKIFQRLRDEKDHIIEAAKQDDSRAEVEALGLAYAGLCHALALALGGDRIDLTGLDLRQRQKIFNGLGAVIQGARHFVIARSAALDNALAIITAHFLESGDAQRFAASHPPGQVLNFLNWLSRGLAANIFDASLPGLQQAFADALPLLAGWAAQASLSPEQTAKALVQLRTMCRPEMFAVANDQTRKDMVLVIKALAGSKACAQMCSGKNFGRLEAAATALTGLLQHQLLGSQDGAVKKMAEAVLAGFNRMAAGEVLVGATALPGFGELLREMSRPSYGPLAGLDQAKLRFCRLFFDTASMALLPSYSAREYGRLTTTLVVLHSRSQPGTVPDKTVRAAALNVVNALLDSDPAETVGVQDLVNLFIALDYYLSMAFDLPAATALCNLLVAILRVHLDSGAVDALPLSRPARMMGNLAVALVRGTDAMNDPERRMVMQVLLDLTRVIGRQEAAAFQPQDRLFVLYALQVQLAMPDCDASLLKPALRCVLGMQLDENTSPAGAIGTAMDVLRYGEGAARLLRHYSVFPRIPRKTRIPLRVRQRLAFGEDPPVPAAPPARVSVDGPALAPKSVSASQPVLAVMTPSQAMTLDSASLPGLTGPRLKPGNRIQASEKSGMNATTANGATQAGATTTASTTNTTAAVTATISKQAVTGAKSPPRRANASQRAQWQKLLVQRDALPQLKQLLAAHADLLDSVPASGMPAICLGVQSGNQAVTRWLLGLVSAQVQLADWGAVPGHVDSFLASIDVFDEQAMLAFVALLKCLKRQAGNFTGLFGAIDVVRLRSMPLIRQQMVEQKLIMPLTAPSTAPANSRQRGAPPAWPIADKPERHLPTQVLEQRMFLRSTIPAIQKLQQNIFDNYHNTNWMHVIKPEAFTPEEHDKDNQWGGGRLQFMATLEELLQRKPATLEFTNANGRTPLLHALFEGQYGAARALMAAGARPDVCIHDLTTLGVVAQQGSIEMAALLLERGVPVNLSSPAGTTALMGLLLEPVGMASFLIRAGAELNVLGPNGISPLHSAVCLRNLPLIELMLQNGADPNLAGDDGYSPLMNAATRGDPEIVRMLIEYGGDLSSSVRVRNMRSGVLEVALNRYREQSTEKVSLSGGMVVSEAGDVVDFPGVIRFLIENGAPFDAGSNSAHRILAFLKEHGDTGLLALLESSGRAMADSGRG